MTYYHIFAIVMVLFTAYFYFLNMKSNSRRKKQNEHATVSEMSKRFRWEILEGDPTFNLVVPNRFTPWAPKEVNVLMRGTTYGHPMEFYYHDKRWTEQTLLGRESYHEFECRLTLTCQEPLPSLEIYSKKPGFANRIESQLQLPAQLFMDEMLDEQFILESMDTNIGTVLSPHLGALLSIGFVHVIVDGHQVILTMNEIGMASAMVQIDQWVHTLETIACALTGKPIPGELSTQSLEQPVMADNAESSGQAIAS